MHRARWPVNTSKPGISTDRIDYKWANWPQVVGISATHLLNNWAHAPVVQKVDNAIHWRNLNPLDNTIDFPHTYALDSDCIIWWIALRNVWTTVPWFATLRLRGRPGRDGCQSALWDYFGERICRHVENASQKKSHNALWQPSWPSLPCNLNCVSIKALRNHLSTGKYPRAETPAL